MKNIFILRNKFKLSHLNIDKYFSFIFTLSILGIFSYYYLKSFHIGISDSVLILSNFSDSIFNVMKLRIRSYDGRFLPFQFIDFYLLNIFYIKSNIYIIAFYMILKVSLCLFTLFLIFKDINRFIYKKEKLNYFLYCFISLFYLTSITIDLFSVYFSEITQSLFCLLFIFFYQRAYFTNKLKYYILALLSCIYVTYMKETMFIPFFVIGVANLLFLDGKQNKLRGGGKSSTYFKRYNIFNYILYYDFFNSFSYIFIL